MTRADLIQDAIVDGLIRHKMDSEAAIVSAAHFDFDPFGERVVAFCPRSRFALNTPASEDTVAYLRDAIEAGLRVHGFYDDVRIEP